MLRITVPPQGGSGVYKLEGRLTGIWADELYRIASYAGADSKAVFNIEEVLYVDARGEQVLGKLREFGASFITESAYGKHLCERLGLSRVGVENATIALCPQGDSNCP